MTTPHTPPTQAELDEWKTLYFIHPEIVSHAHARILILITEVERLRAELSDDMMLSADPLGKIKYLQSRLTAAEARAKELDRLVDLFNNRAEHSISCQKYTLRDCICGLSGLRAELDKLKGTK